MLLPTNHLGNVLLAAGYILCVVVTTACCASKSDILKEQETQLVSIPSGGWAVRHRNDPTSARPDDPKFECPSKFREVITIHSDELSAALAFLAEKSNPKTMEQRTETICGLIYIVEIGTAIYVVIRNMVLLKSLYSPDYELFLYGVLDECKHDLVANLARFGDREIVFLAYENAADLTLLLYLHVLKSIVPIYVCGKGRNLLNQVKAILLHGQNILKSDRALAYLESSTRSILHFVHAANLPFGFNIDMGYWTTQFESLCHSLGCGKQPAFLAKESTDYIGDMPGWQVHKLSEKALQKKATDALMKMTVQFGYYLRNVVVAFEQQRDRFIRADANKCGMSLAEHLTSNHMRESTIVCETYIYDHVSRVGQLECRANDKVLVKYEIILDGSPSPTQFPTITKTKRTADQSWEACYQAMRRTKKYDLMLANPAVVRHGKDVSFVSSGGKKSSCSVAVLSGSFHWRLMLDNDAKLFYEAIISPNNRRRPEECSSYFAPAPLDSSQLAKAQEIWKYAKEALRETAKKDSCDPTRYFLLSFRSNMDNAEVWIKYNAAKIANTPLARERYYDCSDPTTRYATSNECPSQCMGIQSTKLPPGSHFCQRVKPYKEQPFDAPKYYATVRSVGVTYISDATIPAYNAFGPEAGTGDWILLHFEDRNSESWLPASVTGYRQFVVGIFYPPTAKPVAASQGLVSSTNSLSDTETSATSDTVLVEEMGTISLYSPTHRPLATSDGSRNNSELL